MRKFDIDKLLNDLGAPSHDGEKPGAVTEPETPEHGRNTPGTDARPGARSGAFPAELIDENTSMLPTRDAANAMRNVYSPDSSEDERIEADLADDLLAANAVTPEQLSAAQTVLKQSPGHNLADVLFDQDADQQAIQRTVAARAGLAFEPLELDNPEGCIDGELMQRLTADYCVQRRALPLRRDGERVVLGAVEPDKVFMLDEVRRKLGVPAIKVAVITPADLHAAIEQLDRSDEEEIDLEEILGDVEDEDVQLHSLDNSLDEDDLKAQAGESPTIRYVNYILQTAVKEGASDIHVEPGETKMKVRFRIDGILFEMMTPPKSMSAAITSRLKIMGSMDISERRVPQDGRIRCNIGGRKLDLRASTLPTPYGEKTVLRILDTRSINVTLDQLGFDEDNLEIWKRQVEAPHGIVLVTGPTGSGKTTTLYASMRQLDKQRLNISTVEDPIEYHLDGVTQTQTHAKIGMTFASALRALLRQDPDVVLLGEIRDIETASIAIQASMTGHLVLSTLHTNDAPSSVTRLINIGVEPFLVGAALNGVLAQRLVRRICDHCKEKTTPSEEVAEFLEMNGLDADHIYQGTGCRRCRNTGYSGRVGLYEMLVVDDLLRDAIARNPNVSEFRRMCLEHGMRTLRSDGLHKVAKGQTTIEEVRRVTESSH